MRFPARFLRLGRYKMTKARLTRRGKIVLTLAILAVVWFLFDVTTPDACKVAVENMPQWCVDLMYP